MYLQDLQSADPSTRLEAAKALKFLAFNADAEYKDGLVKGGFLRQLAQLMVSSTDAKFLEHAASCMYSMARENTPSKLELLKVMAHKRLVQLLTAESKQLRLNACAALYAISCAGRVHCREVAMCQPLSHISKMLEPQLGRNAQDDQMQLFAALLLVNILHVKGMVVAKAEKQELIDALQRAYDDGTEQQAREIIAMGLKRLQKMGSRSSRLKEGVRQRSASFTKTLTSLGAKSGGVSSGKLGRSIKGFGR